MGVESVFVTGDWGLTNLVVFQRRGSRVFTATVSLPRGVGTYRISLVSSSRIV